MMIMKRIFLLTFSLFSLLAMASCGITSNDIRRMEGKPTGPQVTRLIKNKYFSKIETSLVGDVIYTQSDSLSIRIVGSKAAVEAIKVDFKGDKLVITTVGSNSFKLFGNAGQGVKVYLSSPNLVEVENEGVGGFKAKKIDTDQLKASLEGTGNLQIDTLICDNFKGEVDGTGNLKVGYLEAMSVKASLDGTGDIKMFMVKVPDVKLSIGGTGDIRVRVKDCGTVTSTIDGTGNVVLKGTCKHWIQHNDTFGKKTKELFNVNIK